MSTITQKDLEVSIEETRALQNTMVMKKYAEGSEKSYEDIIERIIRILEKWRSQGYLHPFANDSSRMTRYEYTVEELEDMKVLLRERRFIPAGSILSGCTETSKHQSLSNCYVMSIKEDSIEGIFDFMKEAARTYSYRGGTGVDISTLRPYETPVNNAAKTSTGAVSFMPLISDVNSTIGQAGRKGASLLSIKSWHPDFFRFVWCKALPDAVFPPDNMSFDKTAKALQKLDLSFVDPSVSAVLSSLAWTGKTPDVDAANISVQVTDEFMQLVDKTDLTPMVFYFPDFETDIQFYNENWHGDLDEWIRKGGKVKEYTTSRLFVTKNTVPIFDNKKILSVIVSGQEQLPQSNISQREWLNKLLETHVIFEAIFENPCAYECFNDIARAAWLRADPGVLFWTRVCDWSTFPKIDPQKLMPVCTNPCSEIPSYSGGSCLLGAHFLSTYVKDPWTPQASFDWNAYVWGCITGAKLMNFFSDLNEPLHPLQEQKDLETYAKRIGIEFTGLADMLSMLNMTYNSQEARDFVAIIMHVKAFLELQVSVELAKRNGPCPAASPLRDNGSGLRRLCESEYYKTCVQLHNVPDAAIEAIRRIQPLWVDELILELNERIQQTGLRNVAFNTVGPTGTVSILANNCSSGIEPVFALFMKRSTRVGDKGTYNICHTPVAEHLLAYMKKNNLESIDADEIKKKYSIREAHEIDYHDRIKMQATVQRYCDSSISSTVNLPNSATDDDIVEIYTEAWKAGLKGITIFRDGSLNAVLEVTSPSKSSEEVKASAALTFKKENNRATLTITALMPVIRPTEVEILSCTDISTNLAYLQSVGSITNDCPQCKSKTLSITSSSNEKGLPVIHFACSSCKFKQDVEYTEKSYTSLDPLNWPSPKYWRTSIVDERIERVKNSIGSRDVIVKTCTTQHATDKDIEAFTEKVKNGIGHRAVVIKTCATQYVTDKNIEALKHEFEYFIRSRDFSASEAVFGPKVCALLLDEPLYHFFYKHIDEIRPVVLATSEVQSLFVYVYCRNSDMIIEEGSIVFVSSSGITQVCSPVDLTEPLKKDDTVVKKDEQVTEETQPVVTYRRGEIRKMPKVAKSQRHEVYWSGHRFYIVITVDEQGCPMEIFTSNFPSDIATVDGKFNEADYQFKQSLWVGICRLISISLRGGIPVEAIIKQLNKAKSNITDIMAIIARVLQKYNGKHEQVLSRSSNTSVVEASTTIALQKCPECGEIALKMEAGCMSCTECGYSRCE